MGLRDKGEAVGRPKGSAGAVVVHGCTRVRGAVDTRNATAVPQPGRYAMWEGNGALGRHRWGCDGCDHGRTQRNGRAVGAHRSTASP